MTSFSICAWHVRVGLTFACFFACVSVVTAAPAKSTPTNAANGAASATKFSSQGFSYTVEKLPAWVDSPNPPSASSAYAASEGWHYVLRDSQFRADGKEIAQHVNIIRRINTKAGLEEGAKFSLSFEPSYQRLAFHEITIRRDGQALSRLKPESISLLRREKQLENATYDGFVTAAVNIDDARVGDLISYRYSIVGSNPVLKNRLVVVEPVKSFQATDFVRVRTLANKSRYLNVWGGVGLDRRESEISNSMLETLYSGRALPAMTFRDDAPPIEWIENSLIISEFRNWQEVQAWGRDLFDQPLVGADVLARAREISAKAGDDPRRRIEAALQFVQQDIRYFSMSFGESSHRPTAPSKVLAQRFGDCKDKSLLLIALLREMGISAHPVLVSQAFRGDIDRFPPTHYAFDHAIVAVELDGKAYWLDATRAQQQGALEQRQAWSFRKGLLLNNGQGVLADAPARPAGLVDQHTREEYVVSKMSEPVRLNVESTFTGAWAENAERLLSSPQRAQYAQSFFEYFTNRFEESKVAIPFVSSGGADGDAFVAKQGWDVENAFELSDRSPLKLVVGAWTMSSTLNVAKDKSRNEAVSLGVPRTVKHDIVVKFAEDVVREPLEKTQVVEDEHFRFVITIAQSPREYKIGFLLDVRAERVEPGKLKKFQEKSKEALEQMAVTLTVGAFPMEKLDQVKRELEDLDRKFTRTGKPVTYVQQRAEVDLLMTKHKLESGRLSPKPASNVRRERAIAYDNLGRFDDAMREIAASIALAPKEAAPVMTKMEIQFGKGDFKGILESVTAIENLKRDRSDESFLSVRGRGKLYSGDLAGAAADFRKSVLETAGAEKAFSLLWLYIAEWKRGNKDDVVESVAKDVKLTEWPLPVVRFYRGEIAESELLKAAQDKSDSKRMYQLCEANFYIGQRHLRDGNAREAARAFKRARENEVFEYIEYRAAGFELERVGK
jgi:lipoprotein NlpI/transglutaminase-like putative cysteine protease